MTQNHLSHPLVLYRNLAGEAYVRGIVPLANMFGYATDLRSNTQGRGTFSMEFKCYEQVPANIEKEIISKAGSQE